MAISGRLRNKSYAYRATADLFYETRKARTLTDATSISLSIFAPDGTDLLSGAVVPTKIGVGIYTYRLPKEKVGQRGRYRSLWVWSIGDEAIEDEQIFYVLEAAYCIAEDVLALKLPDSVIPDSINVNDFIQEAADEINAALKSRYLVPISSANPNDNRILRSINANLAAARLVAALASQSESEQVYAYARHLEKRALLGQDDAGVTIIPGLKAIVSGEFVLEGATVRKDLADSAASYVGIKYKDSPFTKLFGDDF